MEIKEIFDKYTSEVAEIYFYQESVKHTFKNEYDQLIKYQNTQSINPEHKANVPFSFHSFSFRNAQNGEDCRFAFMERSLDETINELFLHKNRQYQWFFVEAYEAFEDFIENAYAFAGYNDNNFWPLSDFGNISLSELKGKDYQWFIDQVEKKKGKPRSILNHFNSKLPQMMKVVENNKLGIDLKLAIILIEKLRHHIVHTRGKVSNKEEFIKNVLKEAGLGNQGNPNSKYSNFIEPFFNMKGHSNLISLLEVPKDTIIPFYTYYDIFKKRSNYLLTYAHLLFDCLAKLNLEEVR
jgi:hypothetical protein